MRSPTGYSEALREEQSVRVWTHATPADNSIHGTALYQETNLQEAQSFPLGVLCSIYFVLVKVLEISSAELRDRLQGISHPVDYP